MTDWTIRGTRQDGTSTVGHWVADGTNAAATIKNRYDSGWRSAVLTRDGVEVAWIDTDPDRERVWWVSVSE